MAHEWKIRPRGRSCATCEKPFVDGQECISALFSVDGGYERRDFCLECGTPVDSPFSVWQGSFVQTPSGEKEQEAIKRETAETLLRRMLVDDDEQNVEVIYILAVMLERKKRLVERGVKTDGEGNLIRIYEDKVTGESMVVRDPKLRLDDIEAVQAKIIGLLG